MKVARISAVFLVLMVVGVRQGTPWLSDIWSCIKFGYEFTSKLAEGKSAYDLITDDTSEKLDKIYSSVKDILKEQKELSNNLEKKVEMMLLNLAIDLKNDQEFNRLRTKLTQDYIGRIRNAYKSLNDAAERNYTDETMRSLATQLTSYAAHEINDNLGNIAQLISGGGSTYFANFIDVLMTRTELQTENRCGKGTSLQQEVYELYQLLASTERLAFSTLSYAYTIRSTMGRANFTNEIKGAETDMVDRTRQYMAIIKRAMAQVSTEIHQCEPAEYKRNENFIEFERLHQIVLMPENQTSMKRGCEGECRWYKPAEAPYLASDFKSNAIFGQNCIKCESAGHTYACYPKDELISHRYFGVKTNMEKYGADAVLGSLTQCYDEEEKGIYPLAEYTTHIDSISSKCDVCACTCANVDLDRKWRHSFSLKAELADISNNMVVTGIRFHVTNLPQQGQVVYPQIKVAKLLPEGTASEAEWKEPEIDPKYVAGINGGSDYVVVGRDENQANNINLDDVYTPANHVVTGVKFIYGDDKYRVRRPWYLVHDYVDNGKSVGIVVRMTRCNITSAVCDQSSTTYGYPTEDPRLSVETLFHREELWLEDKDVPTKATKIKPLGETYLYTRFTPSSIKKDFGQSTVPFIDIQPVETSPPAPLGGIGLFLKNEKDFGGFLAFRIMTVNMTSAINDGAPVPEITFVDTLPHDSRRLLLPASATARP